MHVKVKNSLRMKLAVVLLCLTAGTFFNIFPYQPVLLRGLLSVYKGEELVKRLS